MNEITWHGVVQTTNPQHTISDVISAFRPALFTAEVVAAEVAYKKSGAYVNLRLTREALITPWRASHV